MQLVPHHWVCPNCGTSNPDNVFDCVECGTPREVRRTGVEYEAPSIAPSGAEVMLIANAMRIAA